MIIIDKSVIDDVNELRDFLSFWDCYVDSYFATKHGLQKDRDRADEIVNKYKKLISDQELNNDSW